MTNKFKGTGVAIVTPFKEDLKIDYNALSKLLEHIISNGVDFIVALGTTSEAATLTSEEKNELVKFIVKEVNGKLPIVVGIGGNNTVEIANKIKNLDITGIDGILSVAPYYNKPSQEGIYQHFREISKASSLPIIIYNVPSRTSSNINAETVIRLANDFKNIVAIKEASGDFSQVMEIIIHKPKGFEVISGEDALTMPLIAVGMSGVISVIANALPNEMSTMVNLCLNNEFIKARSLHYKILDITNSIFEEGNPSGIKELLWHLDILDNKFRLPLVPVSNALSVNIKKLSVKFDN